MKISKKNLYNYILTHCPHGSTFNTMTTLLTVPKRDGSVQMVVCKKEHKANDK